MEHWETIKASQAPVFQVRKIVLLLMLTFLLPALNLHMHAQAHSRADSINITFERLSIKDGLSQNTVTAVLQDKKGFMWFGTQDGLNRYDGHEFIIHKFSADEPRTLSDNYINVLYEDRGGMIWVGTQNNGLCRFDPAPKFLPAFHTSRGPPAAWAIMWCTLFMKTAGVYSGSALRMVWTGLTARQELFPITGITRKIPAV
jgi:ligand-binding sensor domain-containing protein